VSSHVYPRSSLDNESRIFSIQYDMDNSSHMSANTNKNLDLSAKCTVNIHHLAGQFSNVKYKSKPFTLHIDPDMISKDFSISEEQQQYNNLSWKTITSSDGMSDSYSTSYDWANNRDHQEYQQYDRKKETIERSTSRFQRAAIYQPEATHNSYISELEGNS